MSGRLPVCPKCGAKMHREDDIWKCFNDSEELRVGERQTVKSTLLVSAPAGKNGYPDLPAFSDNWPESVMIKWLEVWSAAHKVT